MLQRNTQLFMEQVGKIIRIIIKPVCDFGDRYFHACIYPDPLKDFLQTLVVFPMVIEEKLSAAWVDNSISRQLSRLWRMEPGYSGQHR